MMAPHLVYRASPGGWAFIFFFFGRVPRATSAVLIPSFSYNRAQGEGRGITPKMSGGGRPIF